MSQKVALNGFGRIGRCFVRASEDASFGIVAANDLADVGNLAYLLKYDSAHGSLGREVSYREGEIRHGHNFIKFFNEHDAENLPWGDLGVHTVIECTGRYRSHELASKHLKAGAKKVIISAPFPDPDIMVVIGINEHDYHSQKHHIISNASCTTNCLAPVAKIVHEHFGIVTGFLTTVHSYTSSQAVVDAPANKWRRGRAAACSIIPTSTGAATAVERVMPELKGRLDGTAMRVPVLNGSVVDFVVQTEKKVSVEDVNMVLKQASESLELKGILAVTEEELVSTDIIGHPASSIVDLTSTMVLGNNMVKIFAWYDNEWGYTCRLRDLAEYIYSKERGTMLRRRIDADPVADTVTRIDSTEEEEKAT